MNLSYFSQILLKKLRNTKNLQMHYTILEFSCPYIRFGTYSAIFSAET